MVKSKLWSRGPGEIDATVGLRPATKDGLTRGQVRFKESLTRQIVRVHARLTMGGIGPNVWTGDNKPHFQCMSFAPIARGIDARVRDGMTVSRKAMRKIVGYDHSCSFMESVKAKTGCEYFIPEEEYHMEDPRNIGFWGTRVQIDAAKLAVGEQVVSKHPARIRSF